MNNKNLLSISSDEMYVDYVDHMGNDLSIVNAARVSYNKKSENMEEKDEKLIRYLARHNHWTPFSHTYISLRIKAPIFIARQLMKHKVGLTENEISRRYVEYTPEMYYPKEWRGKAKTNKQGSEGKVEIPDNYEAGIHMMYLEVVRLYENLLESGVCPEQARMILPVSMFTEWIWTGSLAAFARVYKLRIDKNAQKETQEIAEKIDAIISDLFPISWKVLIE